MTEQRYEELIHKIEEAYEALRKAQEVLLEVTREFTEQVGQ